MPPCSAVIAWTCSNSPYKTGRASSSSFCMSSTWLFSLSQFSHMTRIIHHFHSKIQPLNIGLYIIFDMKQQLCCNVQTPRKCYYVYARDEQHLYNWKAGTSLYPAVCRADKRDWTLRRLIIMGRLTMTTGRYKQTPPSALTPEGMSPRRDKRIIPQYPTPRKVTTWITTSFVRQWLTKSIRKQ